ncbi:DNA-formamidopyrimidine glycosylase family protein [Pedobacter sp. Leaf176]|uniref:DNA-formamidopyrimidine glycosylase family protein n=1 Tax=Pedobacter sp. Leaf176 TaxID=1736286 RepID=UPI0007014A85|nr:DNA-formamidopyrimidine glycosylase family protein [Pedobacter sp. Leaf176]KQR70200.1 formamidopyrimidine-DNA glycosylase [Pedobacter sp. Leaf176]
MAELPDLTVFAQILTRRFKGKTLKEIDVKVDKKLKVSVAELKEALEGQKLNKVSREGKTLQFHFGEHVLGVHLMLRGQLELLEKDASLPKFTVFAFHFSGGEGFAVRDILKQATPTLDPEKAKAPDALDITEAEFMALLSGRKKKIKEVLMDQKALRGIGNSYADELLWDAKISPFSVASAVPDFKVKELYSSLKSVLNEAINFIAKENGDELKGELRDAMKIHGARIKKSPSGAEILSEKIGGRIAYYTHEQKLYS